MNRKQGKSNPLTGANAEAICYSSTAPARSRDEPVVKDGEVDCRPISGINV